MNAGSGGKEKRSQHMPFRSTARDQRGMSIQSQSSGEEGGRVQKRAECLCKKEGRRQVQVCGR